MRRRSVLQGFAVALAVMSVLFTVCVFVLWKLDSAFSPPNPRTLVERLEREETRDLLEETGRRMLAGETIAPADQQRLTNSGVNAVRRVSAAAGADSPAVQFEFGGAENHYGLLVTASPHAAPNIGYTLQPLKGNLWYYSELRPRK